MSATKRLLEFATELREAEPEGAVVSALLSAGAELAIRAGVPRELFVEMVTKSFDTLYPAVRALVAVEKARAAHEEKIDAGLRARFGKDGLS